MEQGIKSDYDLVVKRSSKSRVFMQNFDVECYPFGCAQESPNRLGERELVYELLAAVYPKQCTCPRASHTVMWARRWHDCISGAQR
jgi:hypothetical protein